MGIACLVSAAMSYPRPLDSGPLDLGPHDSGRHCQAAVPLAYWNHVAVGASLGAPMDCCWDSIGKREAAGHSVIA
jgi:hypothetical protein